MMLLHARRASGKTTQAMAWVSHGERIPRYPYWSRVVLVHDRNALEVVRREYWGRLEDFDHRVYDVNEWLRVQSADPDVELCIDNLDLFLRHFAVTRLPGYIAAATITADRWENQTFHESVHAHGR